MGQMALFFNFFLVCVCLFVSGLWGNGRMSSFVVLFLSWFCSWNLVYGWFCFVMFSVCLYCGYMFIWVAFLASDESEISKSTCRGPLHLQLLRLLLILLAVLAYKRWRPWMGGSTVIYCAFVILTNDLDLRRQSSNEEIDAKKASGEDVETSRNAPC